MLDSEEVVRLNGLIRDSFRIRPNQKPKYVDVSNHLARLRSRQHQVVFGRRGSGKSCLFVHFLNDSDAHNNVLPIYVDVDEVKRLGYPDLLVRLLLRIMEETPAAKKRWLKWVFPNPVQRHIRDLRKILKDAETAQVTETEESFDESSIGAKIDDLGVDGKRRRSIGKRSEFVQKKLDELERSLVDYKDALRWALENSRYEAAFILVDDFYLLPRERQPDVIDYLHRLVRGTDLYIKVGTVRHRTKLLRQSNQTIGVELHQDIEEINLDRTLEELGATSEYLSRMLESIAYDAGIDDPKQRLFNPDAFQALVLASGGVARDFLNIFVEAVEAAVAAGQTKWLTPTFIWRGASRLSYRTKISSLRDEAARDASPLERLYRDLTAFCLREKRKTAFLISQDEAQEYPEAHELIHQLMDFKLIHVVEPDTSAASGRQGRFEAYTLDFSLFMEPRRRNLEHVEFWKVDAEGRRLGLREAPAYSLGRALAAVKGEAEIDEIEDVLADVDRM